MENGKVGVKVVKVRAGLKAGGLWGNHNRRLIAVRAGVKAGGIWSNHDRPLLVAVRAGKIV